MNWKRDGLGLLSLENGSKYLGYFLENRVEGKGHLWQEKGDSYKWTMEKLSKRRMGNILW